MEVDSKAAEMLTNLAMSLSELVLNGTVTKIQSKIESIKEEKSIEIVRTRYDEIVNQLLEEREEAVRIAQIYKQELDKVAISDEDIEYLQDTVSKVIDAFNAYQMTSSFAADSDSKAKAKAGIEVLKFFKAFVSKNVLKTMQLLGFNYKAAIGEPLTQVCANAIYSISAPKAKTHNPEKRKK